MMDIFGSTIITVLFLLMVAFVETIITNCIVLYGFNKRIYQNTDSECYKKQIWKTFWFCVLADFSAQFCLTILYGIFIEGADLSYLWFTGIMNFAMGTRYYIPDSIIFSVLVIFLSALFIFVFGRFVIFKKCDKSRKQKCIFRLDCRFYLLRILY